MRPRFFAEDHRPSDSFWSRSEGLDQAEGASTGFMVKRFASGGVLFEGHDGLGVCLTETEGVPPQNRRGDALLRRMPQYLTCP